MKLSIFTEISVFLLDKKKKKIAPRLLQALFNFQSFENVDSGHFYFSFIYLGKCSVHTPLPAPSHLSSGPF